MRRRTMLVNAIRAHLAEFGIVAPRGRMGVAVLLAVLSDPNKARLPALARNALESLVVALETVEQEINNSERPILSWHRSSETSQRLATTPGTGPIIATALTASAKIKLTELLLFDRSCSACKAMIRLRLVRLRGQKERLLPSGFTPPSNHDELIVGV